MLNKIYVDTNIVIDICDNKRPSHKHSVALVKAYLKNGMELYINSDTVSNLFYILRRHSKMNQKELLKNMRLVNTIFTLVPIELDDVNEALELAENIEIPFDDYEDIMQYISAKKVKADLIVTNDKSFVNLDIEIQKSMP